MPLLSRVRVFVEVARLQSFVAAGRALGISGPAASKQVIALEEELGVKLLHRTTRVVTLTDEGHAYYDRVRLALEEMQDAANAIRDMKAAPKGTLKIGAPLSFGHQHLLPTLSGFAKKYPDVRMDIVLEDRTVDVIAEGFDVVIRIGVLQDSSLAVKPLADCPIFPVASAAYLKAHGIPKLPTELKHHRFITYALQGANTEWRFVSVDGKTGSIKNDGALRANTAEMMLQAALDGVGIAILPAFATAPYLKAGKLVRVLPQLETYPRRQIVALMPPSRYRTAKVKLFTDWLGEACAAIPLPPS